MNSIEMANAARELASEYPVSVQAALQMIRDFGGVEQTRRWLKAWAGKDRVDTKRSAPIAEAPLWSEQ